MSETLLERLRRHAKYVEHPVNNALTEAADEIDQLRKALKKIAASYTPDWHPGDTHESTQRLSEIAHQALQTGGNS